MPCSGWETCHCGSPLYWVVASGFVAVLSEFLVGAIEPTAKRFGMSDLFIGVFVVAIVGNAAEHSTAVLVCPLWGSIPCRHGRRHRCWK